ncbi:MAG TPA: hypothetical protein DEE98_05690 [Elusimicrobia bacterium]|nr:MAG: hypothetical protein A2278_00965 [Elusimicrobia bacterium RIFOXYA12_FULL_49_49]OGS09618.1 MAG: hypothetical protein A2204_00905 [Elusimicrobia bacterium RIFOXYA1_FULL_47_7]OGS11414.1 MAG: hypothetical protein A2386_04830 [Elusimicrobia bacterium RIFOXYB1_FULL_48_9]OGS15040.1 MAG: hypothetical protein A2251_00075 [Elusimicrobia bacterium RIFOXYA2_FULL_47_53]OGS29378.1 MAG: hypothetical protein A2323_00360 [Elusimicrobia bacterium RIFOXYB2_FULL_46_23]HBU69859.1 hypothetical protein [Elus
MDTKEKILSAAAGVFSSKGKHGTTMEEVAAAAGVNKAMLYYYYSTKENLYREVLSVTFKKIFKNISKSCGKTCGGDSHIGTIKRFIEAHFDAFSLNGPASRIFIEAATSEHEDFKQAVLSNMNNMEHRSAMHKMINDGIARGIFRKIDPRQMIMNIIGMNMIYMATKPMAGTMLGFDVKGEKKFLKDRKKSIVDMVLNGIVAKREK